jgi:hypothetical protein
MRRPTALALVAICLVPGTAVAAHKPGHSHKKITIAAEPNPTVHGKTVSINGRVTNPDSTSNEVVLQRDPAPFSDDGFSTSTTASASPTGAYILSDEPTERTRYRVRQGKLTSEPVTVTVRIDVTLRVGDETPVRGQRVRLGGRACPAHVGAAVSIQRRGATKWVTVARTRARTATRCSRFAKRVRVTRDGRYRVVVAGDSDHARGISPVRSLDVG